MQTFNCKHWRVGIPGKYGICAIGHKKNPSAGTCAACKVCEPIPGYGQNLIIRNWQGAGDQVLLTAAIRDLHRSHPKRFRTWVEMWGRALLENSPYVERSPAPEGTPTIVVEGFAPGDDEPHLVAQFNRSLAQKLGVEVKTSALAGEIFMSAAEKREQPKYDGDYWLIWAGGHNGFTTKWWPIKHWQAVVDHFKGKLTFVQVGAKEHFHPRLEHVEYHVGTTSGDNLREMVKLMYHAQGAVSGISFGMHLAAAVPTKPGTPKRRPAVVIAGGREAPGIIQYPGQTVLSSIGSLRCCQGGACWRNKVGEDCKSFINVDPTHDDGKGLRIARCMEQLTPNRVIDAIEKYRVGIGEVRRFDLVKDGFLKEVIEVTRPICHACPHFLSDTRLDRAVRCAKARPCCGERDVGTIDLSSGRCPEGKWNAQETPEWRAYNEKEAELAAGV
jgi:hypothetical protein